MPAQAVPWPNRSTGSSGTTWPRRRRSRPRRSRPAGRATTGWLPSTPLSMMATFTPAPVAPPHAQSRSMLRAARPAWRAWRGRRRMNGSDHAGMSWSVMAGAGMSRRSDAAAAARRVRGNHLEHVRHEAQLAVDRSRSWATRSTSCQNGTSSSGRAPRPWRSHQRRRPVPLRCRRRACAQHGAQQPFAVALDARRANGGGGLAREHGQQLHVAQREGGRAALVEHLEHADGLLSSMSGTAAIERGT